DDLLQLAFSHVGPGVRMRQLLSNRADHLRVRRFRESGKLLHGVLDFPGVSVLVDSDEERVFLGFPCFRQRASYVTNPSIKSKTKSSNQIALIIGSGKCRWSEYVGADCMCRAATLQLPPEPGRSICAIAGNHVSPNQHSRAAAQIVSPDQT